MRVRRGPALVLLTLLVALALTPPAAAFPLRPFLLDPFSLSSIDWVTTWLNRLASWLGDEEPSPAGNGDVATCIDPNGNRIPCAP
jgi:hypothetical protein